MAKLNIYHLFTTALVLIRYLLELIKPMIMKKNVVRAPIPSGNCNSLMMNDFHHLPRTLARFTKVLSNW